MPRILLDPKTRIHFEQSGQGQEFLILIHGNLANTLWWQSTLKALPKNYTAIALDLPGSGKSPETGERHTLEYFVSIVKQFTEKLGISSFSLIGHSMGGGVSQLYTLTYPEQVKKLVLLNAMAGDGFHVLFEQGLWRLEKMMLNRDYLDKAIRAIAPFCKDEAFLKIAVDAAFDASPQVYLEQPVTMHESNWLHRLSEIKIPTLFLHGDQDFFVPQKGSERTAAAIPGCVFKYLPQCGHSPMVEVFDLYFKEVFSFLDH